MLTFGNMVGAIEVGLRYIRTLIPLRYRLLTMTPLYFIHAAKSSCVECVAVYFS